MRVLLCLAGIVCLAILAFSAADVEPTAAQTTARVAFGPATFPPDDGDILVLPGVAAGSEATSSTCWTNLGFPSTSPGVIGILDRQNFGISRERVLTTGLVRGRLTNLVLVRACVLDGDIYEIFEGDVAGRP